MDPATHLQDFTETHIAHAANPTPSHGPSHNHPPYEEMITTAIAALKERNGSSKRAIAKYIGGAYTNLPPTHSALLTHHLKRLKNNGHLVMVKHSYTLPRSESSPAIASFATDAPALPKRGRGRPPMPKPTSEPTSEPMLVALGLVDGPPLPTPKRGPGRPPKVKTMELGGLLMKPHRRPQKPKLLSDVMGPSGSKRSRGRPPKPKVISDMLGPSGIKKGPGRPPKTPSIPGVIPYLSNVGKPRGRPKKDGSSLAKTPGRPPRRPRKNVNVVAGGVDGRVALGMRRGRPPKVGGAKKPRWSTGRPVGRPRKNTVTRMVEPVGAQEWMMEYGRDIKNKLEYVQSRIKHAVGMIKPHLTDQNAVYALQELENISSMDIVSAPLHHVPVQDQVEEPPMPPPLNLGVQEQVIQNQQLY